MKYLANEEQKPLVISGWFPEIARVIFILFRENEMN